MKATTASYPADPEFSLLEEGWIPVLFADGAQAELSLVDAIKRAAEVRAVWSENPLEIVAVSRVLIACMLAALTEPEAPGEPRRPLTRRRIGQIDRRGLPIDDVLGYLEGQRGAFFLLGGERPFWQIPPEEPGGFEPTSPVIRLDPLAQVGTNPAFYEHNEESDPPVCSRAEAVRLLCVCQTFVVGSGRGPGGRAFRNGLVGKTAALSVLVGDTLAETLTANLIRIEPDRFPEDRPVWEATPGERRARFDRTEHLPLGPLDSLTWEPRRIALATEESGGVSHTQYRMGVNAADLAQRISARRGDPWMPLRIGEEIRPLALRLDRAAWRDSEALVRGLLPAAEHADIPSALSGLRARAGDAGKPVRVQLAGLIADGQNSIAGQSISRVPLPPARLIEDANGSAEVDASGEEFLSDLSELTAAAEGGERALHSALYAYFKELGADAANQAADESKRAGADYWGGCGARHAPHLNAIARRDPQLESWRELVVENARRAYERTTSARRSGAELQAAARARRRLESQLTAWVRKGEQSDQSR